MTTGFLDEAASFAGGPGAGSAPGGEREGQSPLAIRLSEGKTSEEREGRSRLAWSRTSGERGAGGAELPLMSLLEEREERLALKRAAVL